MVTIGNNTYMSSNGIHRSYTTKSGEVRHKTYTVVKGIDSKEYRREADRQYRARRKQRDAGNCERLRSFTGKTMAELLDQETRDKMVAYRELGLSIVKIAGHTGVSRYVVERALALEHLKTLKTKTTTTEGED